MFPMKKMAVHHHRVPCLRIYGADRSAIHLCQPRDLPPACVCSPADRSEGQAGGREGSQLPLSMFRPCSYRHRLLSVTLSTAGPTNLIVKAGDKSQNELISEIKEGVLVTKFAGFPDPVSGDFSGVVKGGFLIKDGEITRPLIKTLMAGTSLSFCRGYQDFRVRLSG